MNPQTDPALEITNRIARRRERIAKWDKEADEVEDCGPVGLNTESLAKEGRGCPREKSGT